MSMERAGTHEPGHCHRSDRMDRRPSDPRRLRAADRRQAESGQPGLSMDERRWCGRVHRQQRLERRDPVGRAQHRLDGNWSGRPMANGNEERLIELSHLIVDGMTTYKGFPGPQICDFWTREVSAAFYDDGS